MYLRLKTFLLPMLLFTTAFSNPSVSSADDFSHDDWTFTLGLGVFHGPEYHWSEEDETLISPNFEIIWKDRLFLNIDSISINYYRNGSIALYATLSQGDDREESLSASLNGLGNIDSSTTLALEAEIESELFLSYVNLTRHFGGTHGTQMTVGLETAFPLRLLTGSFDMTSEALTEETEDLTFIGPLVIAGLSADWADTHFYKGFFGVDAEQSARSGLPQHTAEAGFTSVNLELGVLYPMSQSWIVHGLAGYSKLMGDTKNSPIVKNDDSVFVGGFINYHF